MYEYRCRLYRFLESVRTEDVTMDIDLGFYISHRCKIRLINVRAPEPRGPHRSTGLQSIEYISSWFEENNNGDEWPFIVRIDRHIAHETWAGEIYALGVAESLNERTLTMGWGDN